MSTITKDLGVVTAYGYYKAGGGTMTESEFTQFMADFGTASETAVEAAQAALASENAARASEETAAQKSTEASQSASTASTKASEAAQSASDANTAKTAAEEARQAAEDVADSIPSDYSQLSADVSAMSTATASDVGKALKAKTVTDGKVVEWEFGEAGGGDIPDNSITYAKLHKAVNTVPQSKVDFWYYNNTKRTDGTSIEVVPEFGRAVQFTYPEGTNAYRVYFVSDDGTDMHYDTFNSAYAGIYKDSANRTITFVMFKAGKFYIPLTFGNTRYFPDSTEVTAVEDPYPTDFLKTGWQPEIMDIDVKYPRRVFGARCYNQNGAVQGLQYQIPTYHVPYVGWYKTQQYYSLLDANWNWVTHSQTKLFYNDGSYAYVQGNGVDKDVAPEYIGDGISAFGDMQVISKGDQLDINKPFGHAIVCFGDSITSTGYPNKLAELAKALVINRGGSGASSNYIRKKVTGIGTENATPFDWASNPVDTAIILAGYNDTYQGTVADDIPSATITDASNDWTAYLALFNASHSAQGTTCGNLGFMIEWLQVNHPEVRILLANYHNNNDSKPQRSADCDVAIQAVSEYYGIQMIDVRRTCGINKKNASTYTVDGLHPNDAGQILLAKAIIRGM